MSYTLQNISTSTAFQRHFSDQSSHWRTSVTVDDGVTSHDPQGILTAMAEMTCGTVTYQSGRLKAKLQVASWMTAESARVKTVCLAPLTRTCPRCRLLNQEREV